VFHKISLNRSLELVWVYFKILFRRHPEPATQERLIRDPAQDCGGSRSPSSTVVNTAAPY
jgi:hypothetical protein